MELMSSPETPKSHILISPRELNKILEGLISEKGGDCDMNIYSKKSTEPSLYDGI
jgi:hypothetical protein